MILFNTAMQHCGEYPSRETWEMAEDFATKMEEESGIDLIAEIDLTRLRWRFAPIQGVVFSASPTGCKVVTEKPAGISMFSFLDLGKQCGLDWHEITKPVQRKIKISQTDFETGRLNTSYVMVTAGKINQTEFLFVCDGVTGEYSEEIRLASLDEYPKFNGFYLSKICPIVTFFCNGALKEA